VCTKIRGRAHLHVESKELLGKKKKPRKYIF
jgi:hypothetical protein